MCRMLATGLIAIAGIAFAAPGPKDAPKRESSIVGEWELLTVNGQKAAPGTYKFNSDGSGVARGSIANVVSPEFRWKYTTDEKANPFEIDMTGDDLHEKGIFKIEGDRLTICFRVGSDRRPRKFGEDGAMEEVFERIKKKD